MAHDPVAGGKAGGRVGVGIHEFGDRLHGNAEEGPAAARGVDTQRLELELLEREVGQLGRLAGAVEGDALDAGARQAAQRLAQGLPSAPVEVERVDHVVVREPALLRDPPSRQQVPQPLARGGSARKLDHLDVTLLDQALEIEVGEPQGHAQASGQRSP